MVETVGRLRKTPALSAASPSKKDMPRSNWGLKPPTVISSRFAEAWKGRLVILVWSLRKKISRVKNFGDGGIDLTIRVVKSLLCYPRQV